MIVAPEGMAGCLCADIWSMQWFAGRLQMAMALQLPTRQADTWPLHSRNV